MPPFLPASDFCFFVPPPPLFPPPPPLFLPPLLDAFGVLAIFAARYLLMPFLRSPSYCLSSLTEEP